MAPMKPPTNYLYFGIFSKYGKKIKIGNIDVDTIPNSIKFGAFLIVVILLFGGVMYLLRKMEKKPKDKKKNKKKKNE